MSIDLEVVMTYEGLISYSDQFVPHLAKYFLWNIQSRYDDHPDLFIKNANRMNTSLEEHLKPFQQMAETKQMSTEQAKKLRRAFDRGQWYLLVFIDSTLVGSGRLVKHNQTEVELHSIFVSPEYRGNKIGSLLLDKLIDIAMDEGFESILLDTMPFMDEAIRLYQSRGFEKSEYTDISGVPEEVATEIGTIFMKLDLRPIR